MCAIAEFVLDVSRVSSVELVGVSSVCLPGWEEDVVGVVFLFSSGVVVRSGVSLWGDMVDLALLVHDNWLPLLVFNVTVVFMLLGVLVVGIWVAVVRIGAMVGVGELLQAIESLELVPDDSVGDGLDLGLLGESWLVGNRQLLVLELDMLNWLVLVSVVTARIASIVRCVPGRGTNGAESKCKGRSHLLS